MNDLLRELIMASQGITRAVVRELGRHGVTRKTLFRPVFDGGLGGHFGVATISTNGRLFDFDENGQPALILPCFGDDDELWDLVALKAKSKPETWSRLDNAPALGMKAIRRSALLKERLTIHRTPWSWLQSGAQGCVILHWPTAVLWLDLVPEILTEDLAHGEDVEARLKASRPQIPRIMVSKV